MSRPPSRGFVTVPVPADVGAEEFSSFLLKLPGSGHRWALQKVAFPSLPPVTETLKPRIVPLHPLPFTPADVFFISLGGLDFPHVLPSSSSRLPRASHNKPACLGGSAGWAADMCAGHASGCFSAQPSQAPGGRSRGPASAAQVGLACLQPAHEFTVLGLGRHLSLCVLQGTLYI